MNEGSLGLIIFALIALGAVFAFIIVFGGPPETTGDLAHSQKIGTSWYKYRDSYMACASGTHCEDGLPGTPTGGYDPTLEIFQCRCQTSNPTFMFYRSRYAPG